MHRLDRLDAGHRELVDVAAVIGRDFDVRLLATAAGEQDVDAVARQVEALARARFVELSGEDVRFAHDWIRHVAYAELTAPRRQALHVRVARALQHVFADDLTAHYAALGHHCLEGHLWAEASRFSRAAGVHAVGRSAHREAVQCFEQALNALSRMPNAVATTRAAIDVRLALRAPALAISRFSRALEVLRDAEPLAAALGDSRRVGWVSAHLAFSLWQTAEYAPAIQSAGRSLEIGTRLGDPRLRAAANYYLGFVHHTTGEFAAAADDLRAATRDLGQATVSERFGFAVPLDVSVPALLAGTLAEIGRFPEASAAARDALEAAERADRAVPRTAALLWAAHVHLRQGNFAAAVPFLEQGFEILRKWEVPVYFRRLARALGTAHVFLGRVRDGLPLLERACGPARRGYVAVDHAMFLAALGEGHLVAGDIEEARSLAVEAIALAQRYGERGHEAWSRRLLAETRAASGTATVEECLESYEQARQMAAALGMQPLVAHCHLGIGTIHHRAGLRLEAAAHVATAVALYRAMQMRFWLDRAAAIA